MGSPIHEMTDEELVKQLDQYRGELREQRFNFAVVRSLQDPGKTRKLKRNIARVLTVQSERERGVAVIQPKSEKGKKPEKAISAEAPAPAAKKKKAKKTAKKVAKKTAKKTAKKAAKKTAKKS